MNHRRPYRLLVAATLVMCCNCAIAVADEPTTVTQKYRLYGLFSPDREQDFRLVMQQLPQFKVVSIDFAAGEATFEYDPQVAFKSLQPQQYLENFNNMVRQVSNSTFGIKPLSEIPPDKLQRLEIPVYGLDCKACSFACYKMLEEVDGVELAIASFKDQRATVLIDPAKTSREALEKRLKEREVSLVPAKVIVVP